MFLAQQTETFQGAWWNISLAFVVVLFL